MIQKIDLIMNTIKGMDIKNKLRLGVCIFSSSYINTSYDKAKIFNKVDAKLKEIDKEYTISFKGIQFLNQSKQTSFLVNLLKKINFNINLNI